MIKIITAVQEVVSSLVSVMWIPLAGFPQAWSLAISSVLFGIVMVFFYGIVSNQKAIRRVKNEIASHIIETFLFRYDTVLSLRAQGRLFVAGVRYFLFALAPMFILALPCILILSHLNLRLGYRPLNVGEERILKVTFADSVDLKKISLSSETLHIVGPVRTPKEHAAFYKLSAPASGVHTIAFSSGVKEGIVANGGGGQISSPLGIFLTSSDWISALFYPNGGSTQKISSQEVVEASFSYPEKLYSFFGGEISWVLPFLVISLLSGYIFSKFVGVAV